MSKFTTIALAGALALTPVSAQAAEWVIDLNGTFSTSFQNIDMGEQDISLRGFYDLDASNVTSFSLGGTSGEYVRLNSLMLSIGGMDYQLGGGFVFGTAALDGGVEILGFGQIDPADLTASNNIIFQPFDVEFGSAGFTAGINYLAGTSFRVNGLSGAITGGSGSIRVNAVPEPATWAMMIAGFGLVGFATRRRSVAVRFA